MELHEHVERIRSREDLVDFIRALRADLLARPDEWENTTLEHVLKALAWHASYGGAPRRSDDEEHAAAKEVEASVTVHLGLQS